MSQFWQAGGEPQAPGDVEERSSVASLGSSWIHQLFIWCLTGQFALLNLEDGRCND